MSADTPSAAPAPAVVPEEKSKRRKIPYLWTQLAILAAIVLVGLFLPQADRLTSWYIIMILMTAFILIAGKAVTGFWLGAMIDERNKCSLSRLQMLLWTIVVLSAFLCAALLNVSRGRGDALAIALPIQLLFLMGISATSLVGSPLVRNQKKDKEPNAAQAKNTTGELEKVLSAKPKADGLILYNQDPANARLGDLFRGEETGNGARLDLGKIQMFFFTAVLVIAYVAALSEMFKGSYGSIDEFPALHGSTTALLGISHTGYLAHKALPLSKEK